jgi:hypothetical protein
MQKAILLVVSIILCTAASAQSLMPSKADNLSTCMSGDYPSLCHHDWLTPDQRLEVRNAEHRANYALCSSGEYPAICRHDDLMPGQRQTVVVAEHKANLQTCLQGMYAALCHHQDLTADEARRVSAAEATHPAPKLSRSFHPRRSVSSRGSNCESGHWIESVMDDGSIIKLEDDSLWEVDGGDTATSSVWVGASEIVVCGDRLINTDDSETVHAAQIR